MFRKLRMAGCVVSVVMVVGCGGTDKETKGGGTGKPDTKANQGKETNKETRDKPDTQTDKEGWTEYTSKKAGFKALFPSKPTEKATDMSVHVQHIAPGATYSVLTQSLPDVLAMQDPTDLLKEQLQTVSKFTGAWKEQYIKVAGYPAVRYRGGKEKDPEGTPETHVHIIAGKKTFTLSILTSKDKHTAEYVDKFIDSFEVLKK